MVAAGVSWGGPNEVPHAEGASDHRNPFPHSAGGQTSETEVRAGLVPSDAEGLCQVSPCPRAAGSPWHPWLTEA